MSHSRHRFASIVLLIAFIAFGLFIFFDWRAMYELLAKANWLYGAYALLFTALSYIATSIAFVLVSRLFQLAIPGRRLFSIGFFTIALNNLFSFGGAVGYFVRVGLLKNEPASPKEVIAASLAHSYLSTFALFAFSPLVMAYLFFAKHLTRRAEIFADVAGLAAFAVFVCVSLLLALPSFRRRFFALIEAFSKVFARRSILPALQEMDDALARGMGFLRGARHSWLSLALLIVIDLTSEMAALLMCFFALGSSITPGVLFVGFFFGVVAGMISMIPGGLGVQEGSMAAVFALFGVSALHAAFASILFRLIYYFVPLAFSYAIYFSATFLATGDAR